MVQCTLGWGRDGDHKSTELGLRTHPGEWSYRQGFLEDENLRRGLKEQESDREEGGEWVFRAAATACSKAQRLDNTRCAGEIHPRGSKCVFLAVRTRQSQQVSLPLEMSIP